MSELDQIKGALLDAETIKPNGSLVHDVEQSKAMLRWIGERINGGGTLTPVLREGMRKHIEKLRIMKATGKLPNSEWYDLNYPPLTNSNP